MSFFFEQIDFFFVHRGPSLGFVHSGLHQPVYSNSVFFFRVELSSSEESLKKRRCKLFVVLRFQMLVSRYLGFIEYAEKLLICVLRLLDVEGCRMVAVDDGNVTTQALME